MPDPVLRGVFVTGTDTGVGKTVVAAALLGRFRTDGPTRYWKPIQTGIEDDDDSRTVSRLSGCQPREVFNAGIRLPRPLSPHHAAAANGSTILLDDLLALASAQPAGEFWVVEGAGGVLVPINADELMIDFMVRLGLPAIVVARSALGTINHTLLTLEALRQRAIDLAGVVMVGDVNAGNRESIERYGRVSVLGELPILEPLTADSLQRASTGWTLPGGHS